MKAVRIFFVTQVVLSMLVSSLGIDIYNHYCGETGNRYVSLFYKAQCSPDEENHPGTDCCSSHYETDGNSYSSGCHHHDDNGDEPGQSYTKQCSDEYKQYSEDLTSIVYDNNIKLATPVAIIRIPILEDKTNYKTNNESYIKNFSHFIINPIKKLYLFVNMKSVPSEPLILA